MREHDELLHEAFDEEVEALTIGPSPMAAVLRDGAVLRTRRRAALVSGAAALAVLPVAAVAVFGGGGAKSDMVQAATSGTTSAATPGPAPITVPATAAGQGNPDLPNDQVVVLESGTFQGKAWRFVRDRHVVEKVPYEVKGEAAPQPHLPFDQWSKPGTTECESVGIQWGDQAPASPSDFNVGSMCGETDKTPLDNVLGVVNAMTITRGPDGTQVVGRVDATKVASVTVSFDGGAASPKLPVAMVAGEKNGYYVYIAPPSKAGAGKFVAIAYDAQGVEVGRLSLPSVTTPSGPPPQPTGTAKKK